MVPPSACIAAAPSCYRSPPTAGSCTIGGGSDKLFWGVMGHPMAPLAISLAVMAIVNYDVLLIT